jgi:metallo-beta-lactamase family protein
MIKYLDCQDKKQLKMIFLVHGEYDVQEKYKTFIESAGFNNIQIPSSREEFEF